MYREEVSLDAGNCGGRICQEDGTTEGPNHDVGDGEDDVGGDDDDDDDDDAYVLK
jgi:hypothetical protein